MANMSKYGKSCRNGNVQKTKQQNKILSQFSNINMIKNTNQLKRKSKSNN